MTEASEAIASMVANGSNGTEGDDGGREGNLTAAAAMVTESMAMAATVTGNSGRRQQWKTVTATGNRDR